MKEKWTPKRRGRLPEELVKVDGTKFGSEDAVGAPWCDGDSTGHCLAEYYQNVTVRVIKV
jgi:hypothetical protein